MRKIYLLCLSALSIFLTACDHKNTDVTPLAEFNATLPVHTVWSTSVGGGAKKENLRLSPVLLGDQIYADNFNGSVEALDAKTGKSLWVSNTKHRLTTGLGGDENYLFVGTKDGEILAVSRDWGHVVWHQPLTNEVFARPNGNGSVVIVKSVDDHVYAFQKRDGQPVWNYKESTPDLALRGGGVIQVAGGVAIVGFEDGQVGAFSVKNGDMLWKQAIGVPQGVTSIDEMNDINDGLLIQNGVLYAAAYQGTLSAVELHSGKTLWSHDVSAYSGVAVDGNRVYVSDAKGHVVAFNRRTGTLLWEQNKLSGRGLTGPAVVDNAVVVGDSKGYVHWLSALDGHFIAREQVDNSGITAAPIARGNEVYVYSNAGRLVKYRS